jgi:hypothetical protein
VKLLTIGFGLPNAEIDNYHVLNAPSYFDYDAILVDPGSVTETVRQLLDGEKTFEAHDGRPVINGGTTSAGVSATDQVQRRAAEARQFLEDGGTIVVMGRPNTTQAGLLGFEGCDRYSWLPAPAGAGWGPPLLRAAEGKRVLITDDTHPLADLLRDYRRNLSYRAVFDEMHPAVRQHGHIIARGGGNAPIGVEFKVLAGHVIFIPVIETLQTTARQRLAQEVVDTMRRMTGGDPDATPPYWARTVAVPGLEQAEAEVETAAKAAKQAQERLDAAKARQAELAGYRAMLWSDGRTFARVVRNAFETLGFTVTSQIGEPLVVLDDGQAAFVEAASAADIVVEWPYVHLQRRLEEHLLSQSEQLKGIVVANAHRSKKPEERKNQVTQPLRIACENYRYALLTTETLFALVQRALAGTGDDVLAGVRRRIMRANGMLALEEALAEKDSGKQAETLF